MVLYGGRKGWELEGRPLTTEMPQVTPTRGYRVEGQVAEIGALRRGHIPGAVNIPWSKAVNPETGAFLSAEQLRSLYEGQGLTPDLEVAAYCRIGERSAHTWFVLHELLGYPNVRNYDGSWTEWGSLVRAPIEKNV